MTKKRLLYLAAFFTLFTFFGHSLGTLIPTKNESEQVLQARAVMDMTFVEMPFGSAKTLGQMAYGGNAFISLYLLVSGIVFVMCARDSRAPNGFLILNIASLSACAVLSMIYFFPLPAVCTGFAAALGFMGLKSSKG